MSDMLIEGECSEETRNVMAELEGRIRGLEAVITEILTPEHITTARQQIRKRAQTRDRKWCEIMELLNQPLDKQAEAELDTLADMVENKQA
jgi:hypothetical protein